MRVIEKADGTYAIEDQPIRIDGEAARRVREEMRDLEQNGSSPERKRFLAECERIYRTSRTGSSE